VSNRTNCPSARPITHINEAGHIIVDHDLSGAHPHFALISASTVRRLCPLSSRSRLW
jgi:hypothetical protein